MATKQALRRYHLARLREMAPAHRREAAAAIAATLLGHPVFQQARGLCGYLSLPEEVETRPVLAMGVRQGKAVFVPRVVLESPALEWVPWRPTCVLEAGPLGIQQPPAPSSAATHGGAPKATAATPLDTVDLVLVPGVAFDIAGRRLGRGKGYYDRFLAQLREQCRQAGHLPPPAVALAFDSQLAPNIPTSPWDLPVDAIVTESGWPLGLSAAALHAAALRR